LTVGATYRVTAVVGQRASRSGALDGYRSAFADAATSPPRRPRRRHATTDGQREGLGLAGSPPVVTIAAALRIDDRDVRIDGIVTAPATLLDATGRRIVVQDASAAVELLLPTGTAAPPVGTRIRATGRMGVAYSAPTVARRHPRRPPRRNQQPEADRSSIPRPAQRTNGGS
jgi:hypothetical protein